MWIRCVRPPILLLLVLISISTANVGVRGGTPRRLLSPTAPISLEALLAIIDGLEVPSTPVGVPEPERATLQVSVKLSDLFPDERPPPPPPPHHLPASSHCHSCGRKLAQHTTSTASARQLLSAPYAAPARRKPLGTSSASASSIDLEKWREKASPKDRESLDTLTGGTGSRKVESSPPVTLSTIGGNPRGRRLLVGFGGVQPQEDPYRRALLENTGGSSGSRTLLGSFDTWAAGASAENQKAAKALGALSGSSKPKDVKISDLNLDK